MAVLVVQPRTWLIFGNATIMLGRNIIQLLIVICLLIGFIWYTSLVRYVNNILEQEFIDKSIAEKDKSHMPKGFIL